MALLCKVIDDDSDGDRRDRTPITTDLRTVQECRADRRRRDAEGLGASMGPVAQACFAPLSKHDRQSVRRHSPNTLLER
jgi:hypothetical protein